MSVAEEIEVPAGRVLIRQGDRGKEAFVIHEGRAKAAIRGKGSAKLQPGDCFGEMALLHSAPRSATVTAETDMRLLVIGSRNSSNSNRLVDVANEIQSDGKGARTRALRRARAEAKARRGSHVVIAGK